MIAIVLGRIVLMALEEINKIVEQQQTMGQDIEDADVDDVVYDVVTALKRRIL